MSPTEIAVVVFGLIVGYWVVSKLFLGTPPAAAGPKAADEPKAQEAPSAAEDATGAPWHQVLGVSPLATMDEIRAAYKSLLGQYHPDKVATLGNDLRELAEKKSKEITGAYRDAVRAREKEA